jgi:hypothetical protein
MSTPSFNEIVKRVSKRCRNTPDIDSCRLPTAYFLELSRFESESESNDDGVLDYLLGDDPDYAIALLLRYTILAIILAILIVKAAQILRRFVAHHVVAR